MPPTTLRTAFILLLFAAIVSRVPLLLRPAEEFHARPFIEDAYYSLTVARSLGHGNGLTIDGQQRTNGIQPLIVFLYAPAFALLDDDDALRVCLAIAMLIELLLVVMLWRLMLFMGGGRPDAGRAAGVAVFLLLFGYASTVYTLNGLETALVAALAVALTTEYFRLLRAESASGVLRYVALGTLAGFTVLARIDAAFLVAIVFALHLFWRPSMHIPRTRRILQAGLFGTSAVLVSLPWWVYNYVFFGSVTPTSGLSQRVVIPVAENLLALVQYLANTLFVVGYIPYAPQIHPVHILALGGATIVALALVFVPRIRGRAGELLARCQKRWSFSPLLPLVLYVAAMAGYYVFNFGAPHFLQRYLFTGHVVWVVVISVAAAELWMRIEARSARWGRFLAAATTLAILAVYALPYSWYYSPAKALENDFLQVSQYIARELPPSARIGMGQSGTAGFFNANVVNLDGKVNATVFRANEAGRLCAYIDSARFDYLIDWPHFFGVIDSCAITSAYVPNDTIGRFVVKRNTSEVNAHIR